MSIIVKNMSKLILPLIFTFGMYIVLHANLTPGGGFQGSAILSSAVALLLIVFGKKRSGYVIKFIETVALLCFILIGIISIDNSFLNNFIVGTNLPFGKTVNYGINNGDVNTSGTIYLFNILVSIEVFCALSLILYCMYSVKP